MSRQKKALLPATRGGIQNGNADLQTDPPPGIPDRLWLGLSASGSPWLGRAEEHAGEQVLGGELGVHTQAGHGRRTYGGYLPRPRKSPALSSRTGKSSVRVSVAGAPGSATRTVLACDFPKRENWE